MISAKETRPATISNACNCRNFHPPRRYFYLSLVVVQMVDYKLSIPREISQLCINKYFKKCSLTKKRKNPLPMAPAT